MILFLSTPKLTLFMLWLLTVKAKEASFCMIEKTALCLEVCMYMFLIYIHIYSHTLGTTYTYTQCSTPIKLSVSQMIAFLFPIKYAGVYVKLLRRVYSYPISFLDNLCLSHIWVENTQYNQFWFTHIATRWCTDFYLLIVISLLILLSLPF